MKAALALVLAACTSAADGIPGDVSPDDPTAQPDETNDGKADKAPQQITLGKGVVMASPTVVHVYWGGYWTTDAGAADRGVLDGFTASVGGSSWWGITAEYPDGHGTAPGAPAQGAPLVAADSEPPSKLYATDTALHQFLAAQLASGALAYDAETLYVVIPAPGTAGVRGECGHHSYFSASVGGGRHKVIYALVPYLGADPSCGVGIAVNGDALDQMTATLSHEIAEAATDPYLDAWMTGDGVEIADQCDGGVAASWGGASYAVQDLWSNAQSACIH